MNLGSMFNELKEKGYVEDVEKCVKDGGKPEGTVSHRKNGDFIKQGGEWKPYKVASVEKKTHMDRWLSEDPSKLKEKENNAKLENQTATQVLKSSAAKISKRSGGKFKLTENKDPAKKGKYELKIGSKSYMVNSTEEAENFVDGYMEVQERTGSKPAILEPNLMKEKESLEPEPELSEADKRAIDDIYRVTYYLGKRLAWKEKDPERIKVIKTAIELLRKIDHEFI